MMYKEAKAFKGFEVWFHAFKMTFKMHMYIILTILMIQFLIVLLYWLLIRTEEFVLIVRAFFSFSFVHMIKAVKYFIVKSLFVFLIVQCTWLLYPALLTRFKMKAQEIMSDQHLRGSQLVTEEELRELVMQRIKKEYEEKKYRDEV